MFEARNVQATIPLSLLLRGKAMRWRPWQSHRAQASQDKADPSQSVAKRQHSPQSTTLPCHAALDGTSQVTRLLFLCSLESKGMMAAERRAWPA